MDIIKLDRRHAYYKHGFTYGFRGGYSTGDARKIEDYLERVYGYHKFCHEHPWFATFTKSLIKVTPPGGHEYRTNAFWIYVRNPADVTAILLAISADV
jgi:hypothetical protein